MERRRKVTWLVGPMLALVGVASACVDPLDLTGRPCPCAEDLGFVCCDSSRRCVRAEEVAGLACRPPADPASGGLAPEGTPDPIDAPGLSTPDAGAETPDVAPPPDGPSADPPEGGPAACTGDPRGVRALHWDGIGYAGLMATSLSPAFAFHWSDGPPDPSFDEDATWSSIFTTQLRPDVGGDYTFFVDADDGFQLWLDREMVLSWGRPQGTAGRTMAATVPLLAGRRYDVMVDYFNERGPGHLDLTWAPPGGARSAIPACELYLGPLKPANCPDPFGFGCASESGPTCTCDDKGAGLDVSFFADPEHQVAVRRVEGAQIDFNFILDWLTSPSTSPAVRDARYLIRWEGTLRPPLSEAVTFFLLSDAEATLYLGDQQLKVVPDASGIMKEATLTMAMDRQAPYPIRVEYLQRGPADSARIQLNWRSPSMPKKPVDYCYLYASAALVRPCRPRPAAP